MSARPARPQLVGIDKEIDMTRKTLLAGALVAGSLLGLVSAAQAVPAVVAGTGGYAPGVTVVPGAPAAAVVIQPAPPTPIYEPLPAPREGYVWSPGHYEWRDGQYVWFTGEWLVARPGFAWRAGHWEQLADGSWRFMNGHWMRADRLASNDWRSPYGDRDRDGIVNRDDHYPRDPTRY